MFNKLMESTLLGTAKALDMVAYATMATAGKDRLGVTLIEVPPLERTMTQVNCELIVAHRREQVIQEEKIALLREKQALAKREIELLQKKHKALLSELEGLNR